MVVGDITYYFQQAQNITIYQNLILVCLRCEPDLEFGRIVLEDKTVCPWLIIIPFIFPSCERFTCNDVVFYLHPVFGIITNLSDRCPVYLVFF